MFLFTLRRKHVAKGLFNVHVVWKAVVGLGRKKSFSFPPSWPMHLFRSFFTSQLTFLSSFQIALEERTYYYYLLFVIRGAKGGLDKPIYDSYRTRSKPSRAKIWVNRMFPKTTWVPDLLLDKSLGYFITFSSVSTSHYDEVQLQSTLS